MVEELATASKSDHNEEPELLTENKRLHRENGPERKQIAEMIGSVGNTFYVEPHLNATVYNQGRRSLIFIDVIEENLKMVSLIKD